MDRLDIIVPVYNEGNSVHMLYAHLCNSLNNQFDWQAFFIYDYEGDTTLPALIKLQQNDRRIKPVLQTYGRGVANALRYGFHITHDGPVAVVMGDDSDELEALPRMMELYKSRDAAVIACSRHTSGGRYYGGTWIKKILSNAAGWMLYKGGLGTRDPTNNYKLYRGEFIRQHPIESNGGFEIALELTVKAAIHGKVVDEVAGTWRDRTEGASNFKLIKWLPHYLRWFGLFWMHKFKFKTVD